MEKGAAEDKLDCGNAVDQMTMNMCADAEFKRQDTLLNTVYRAYRDKITVDLRAGLTKAQKAWLTFRDTECEFEAAEYAGGSMRPMIYDQCLSDLTNARRTALEGLLKDEDN